MVGLVPGNIGHETGIHPETLVHGKDTWTHIWGSVQKPIQFRDERGNREPGGNPCNYKIKSVGLQL